MRITGFIWLEEVLEKFAKKHHIQEHEVVEVFETDPKFRYVERGIEKERTSTPPLGEVTQEDTWLYSSFTRKTVTLCRSRRAT